MSSPSFPRARIPTLLVGILGLLFLLGCACARRLSGSSPRFDAMDNVEYARNEVERTCLKGDRTTQDLIELCDRAHDAVARELLSPEQAKAFMHAVFDAIDDGCQPSDIDPIVSRFPLPLPREPYRPAAPAEADP